MVQSYITVYWNDIINKNKTIYSMVVLFWSMLMKKMMIFIADKKTK